MKKTPERADEHASRKAEPAEKRRGGFTERMIDETLRESFPASDPPGWVLGTDAEDEKPDGEEPRK